MTKAKKKASIGVSYTFFFPFSLNVCVQPINAHTFKRMNRIRNESTIQKNIVNKYMRNTAIYKYKHTQTHYMLDNNNKHTRKNIFHKHIDKRRLIIIIRGKREEKIKRKEK